jgi:hypothetical protein
VGPVTSRDHALGVFERCFTQRRSGAGPEDGTIFSQRSGSGGDTPSVSAHSPRMVLVEEEEPVRLAVDRALRREGIAVAGFADYTDPGLVLAVAPDLAVLDVPSPAATGSSWRESCAPLHRPCRW